MYQKDREIIDKYIGKKIRCIEFSKDREVLMIVFTDGTGIEIWDNGQDCCEHRYMHVQDDLHWYEGSYLVEVEVVEAPDAEDDYGVHEVCFLNVRTTGGLLQVSNHNEHNGYYGGFGLAVREVTVAS